MPVPTPRDAAREDKVAREYAIQHDVKSWPYLFEATLSGRKKHDMRRVSDRDYQVGDTLRLCEYDPEMRSYTGRELRMRISYITSAEYPCALSGEGLDRDFCILSLERLSEQGK